MNRKNGFWVPPSSKNTLTAFATKIRKDIGLLNSPFFPVTEFLEWSGIPFDIKTTGQMRDNLGLTKSDGIEIREDVYDKACNHSGFDRFTIAHEIIHYLFHREHIAFARNISPLDKIYCNSEWQADFAAGALLVPTFLLNETMSTEYIAREFGVSLDCAKVRRKIFNE